MRGLSFFDQIAHWACNRGVGIFCNWGFTSLHSALVHIDHYHISILGGGFPFTRSWLPSPLEVHLEILVFLSYETKQQPTCNDIFTFPLTFYNCTNSTIIGWWEHYAVINVYLNKMYTCYFHQISTVALQSSS